MKKIGFILLAILFVIFPTSNSFGEEAIPGGPEILVAEDEYLMEKGFHFTKTLKVTIHDGWKLVDSQETIPCGTNYLIEKTKISGIKTTAAQTLVDSIGGELGVKNLAQIEFAVSENTQLSITLSEEEEVKRTWEVLASEDFIINWIVYQRYQKYTFEVFEESIFPVNFPKFLPVFNFLDKFDPNQTKASNCDGTPIEKIEISNNELTEKTVPAWIKEVAKFWVDGVSNDEEFIYALQWFVENDIIQVPYTESIQGEATAIPSWIKNTVSYWIEDISSDAEFISAIQHLIKIGIIRV